MTSLPGQNGVKARDEHKKNDTVDQSKQQHRWQTRLVNNISIVLFGWVVGRAWLGRRGRGGGWWGESTWVGRRNRGWGVARVKIYNLFDPLAVCTCTDSWTRSSSRASLLNSMHYSNFTTPWRLADAHFTHQNGNNDRYRYSVQTISVFNT